MQWLRECVLSTITSSNSSSNSKEIGYEHVQIQNR